MEAVVLDYFVGILPRTIPIPTNTTVDKRSFLDCHPNMQGDRRLFLTTFTKNELTLVRNKYFNDLLHDIWANGAISFHDFLMAPHLEKVIRLALIQRGAIIYDKDVPENEVKRIFTSVVPSKMTATVLLDYAIWSNQLPTVKYILEQHLAGVQSMDELLYQAFTSSSPAVIDYFLSKGKPAYVSFNKVLQRAIKENKLDAINFFFGEKFTNCASVRIQVDEDGNAKWWQAS